MANVNVGKRTAAQDREAAQAKEQEVTAEGATIVEEDGMKFAVTEAFGMTVKTRIA